MTELECSKVELSSRADLLKIERLLDDAVEQSLQVRPVPRRRSPIANARRAP
jgi:hypothetical protein